MVTAAAPSKPRTKAPPPPAAEAANTAALAAITHRLTGSTGTMIDALWAVREQKRALEASLKEVEEKQRDYEVQLEAKMAGEGLDKAAGKAASASFSTTITASVEGDEGWSLLYAYIAKNKFWHLLQRRVSDPAYRELLEKGKKVPGVQPFPKKRLTLRTLSS